VGNKDPKNIGSRATGGFTCAPNPSSWCGGRWNKHRVVDTNEKCGGFIRENKTKQNRCQRVTGPRWASERVDNSNGLQYGAGEPK
jgi:hypothetical protein